MAAEDRSEIKGLPLSSALATSLYRFPAYLVWKPGEPAPTFGSCDLSDTWMRNGSMTQRKTSVMRSGSLIGILELREILPPLHLFHPHLTSKPPRNLIP